MNGDYRSSIGIGLDLRILKTMVLFLFVHVHVRVSPLLVERPTLGFNARQRV